MTSSAMTSLFSSTKCASETDIVGKSTGNLGPCGVHNRRPYDRGGGLTICASSPQSPRLRDICQVAEYLRTRPTDGLFLARVVLYGVEPVRRPGRPAKQAGHRAGWEVSIWACQAGARLLRPQHVLPRTPGAAGDCPVKRCRDWLSPRARCGCPVAASASGGRAKVGRDLTGVLVQSRARNRREVGDN